MKRQKAKKLIPTDKQMESIRNHIDGEIFDKAYKLYKDSKSIKYLIKP